VAAAEIVDAAWSSFVAIDFETANEQPGSPCSVGWAVVDAGRIVDVGAGLIRPPAFRFADRNIAIHGIRPDDVANAAEWPPVLDWLVAKIAGRPLVAHNAGFDMGVIVQACELTGSPVPPITFACSLEISRHVWPELHSHALGDVADALDLPPFAHHEAGADARVAAEIVLAAALEMGRPALLELLTAIRMEPRSIHGVGYHAFGIHDGNHRIPRVASEGAELDPGHPFFGKKVTFTGDLSAMERPAAQQAILDVGGRPMTNVSKKTDFVVVGSVFSGLVPGHASSKLETAQDLIAAGAAIRIVSEQQFLALLGQGT
jgi:DNA polymerase III epsilon subunit-like protein